ncbi:MAG: hypothetical protein CL760_00875 [Chloroflexi bacterium]|nr:hypothetical protein [Chloroflexota bacterium]|tara:strand:+ start:31989 stop:33398 length:1410 start_codon:yes stop_codon:yes gene_type:complete
MLNKIKTLETLLLFKNPIIKSIQRMDSIKNNYVDKTNFQIFIKEQITIVENLNEKKQVVEQIKNAYSLKNLISHRLINFDDGEDKLSFTSYIEDMFRDISEDIKPKPITRRTFLDHINNLDNLIKDSYDYHSYNKIEKELFVEDLKRKLNVIKQDFEKNKNIIENEADNLSQFLEDDTKDIKSKREMMTKIIELSDKYIEPFFNFIQERRNKEGFISKLKKIGLFFEELDDTIEAYEISRFVLNFKGYNKEIFNIYEKINDYRRKGREDLTVYNAFEKAFNNLHETSEELLDGLLVRNTLESSNFHESFNLLSSIKANNFKKTDISMNYDDLSSRFDKIEETLLIDKDKTEEEIEHEIDDEKLKSLEKIETLFDKKGKINIQNTQLISDIIGVNMKNLMTKDDKYDIIYKLHTILSSNMSNYDVFFTVYAYNSIRKRINNVKVGYNERNRLKVDDKIYEYRPVYNLGGN